MILDPNATPDTYVNLEHEFELPGGIVCKWSVEASGQEEISVSDKLLVQAIAMLPANNDSTLDSRIAFNERLNFFDEALSKSWGLTNQIGFRTSSVNFVGDTWADAIKAAYSYVDSELQKLYNALSERQAKLMSKGCEFLAARILRDQQKG